MADDHHPVSPLEALNARGLTAKREYVRGLEQRHDAEALSLLTECLCDESWFLRDLAEQAFFRLGEAHAEALLPLLEGGLWYTRLSSARLLGRLGFRPAVPALLELCGDGSETVALAAREAIVAVARQGCAARLAHALHRESSERRKQRLAEIAERDRALAKNLERLMADVDLMAADHPDRLVDPEEPAASAAPLPKVARGGPRAPAAPPPPLRPAVPAPAPLAAVAAPKPPDAVSRATPMPSEAVSRAAPKPPEAVSPGAPKPRASHAPPAPKTQVTRKPSASPGPAPPKPAAPAPEPEAPQLELAAPPAPPTPEPPASTAAGPAPSSPVPHAAQAEPGEAPPGS